MFKGKITSGIIKLGVMCLVALLFSVISFCNDEPEKTTKPKEVNIQAVIDSAQNVIRDSIKAAKGVSYWSSYETGLPKGTVGSMHSFSNEKWHLDGRESTGEEYCIIKIRQENGEMTSAIVTHDQYITIEPDDIIK